MIQKDDELDLLFEDCNLGVSARRIYEHIHFRQVNPFESITLINAGAPEKYVDIIDISGANLILTNVTLSDVINRKASCISDSQSAKILKNVKNQSTHQWLNKVKRYLQKHMEQKFVRNLPKSFLPYDNFSSLSVKGLNCALHTWLKEHSKDKATVEQWLHRIKNLSQKGLRAEELKFNFDEDKLTQRFGEIVKGEDLIKYLTYDHLKLSIVPMIKKTGHQLTFEKVPVNIGLKKFKPKFKSNAVTQPQWRDLALGYRIDVVNWNDLLSEYSGWVAFTYRGEPIVSYKNPTGLCDSYKDAMLLANAHAYNKFPRLNSNGLWLDYRITGGAQYREWLFTLPYFASSYFSDHYAHRNIIFHIRCDIRESVDGKRVVLIQEVQSDWAQESRRNLNAEEIPRPPWLNEWHSLALKLMLLHASQLGADALVWTQGKTQIDRYGGLGKNGLIKLYDHTLPDEITKILKPYGHTCETIEVYRPLNYFIDPIDIGYKVSDENGNCLGTAKTWDEANNYIPDGAENNVEQVHGVKLDESLRQRLLKDGFYAWGTGIK